MHFDVVKTAFSGFSSREALGLAFLRAWSSSFFSSALVFGSISNAAGWGSLAHEISLVAFMATFMAIGFAHRSKLISRLLRFRKTAATLVIVGSACIVATIFVPGVHWGFLAFGGIVTGIGSASITTSWGIAIARKSPPSTIYGSTLGLYFFTTMFALALASCTVPVLIALSLASPAISIAYLLIAEDELPSQHDETAQALPPQNKSRFVGVLVYIAVTSIVIGAIGAYCNDVKTYGLDMTMLIVLAMTTISALAYLLFGEIRIKALLTGTSLALAVFLLALPFDEGNPLVYVLGIAGKAHGWIVVWTFVMLESARVKSTPGLYIGLGLGFHYAGFLVGQTLMDAMRKLAVADFHSYLFPFSLVCMFLLVISYFIAISSLQKDSEIDTGLNAAENEPHNGAVAEDELRPFDRKVALASEHYGLTEREQEIMWHLAKGYSSKAIQAKLYISASTVSAHSGNIYRKMNVHSKEEVGEIVRSWELESPTTA